MRKTYDPKCFALAEAFLAGEPRLNTEAAKIALATAIQECIEDEIDFMESMLPPTRKECVV